MTLTGVERRRTLLVLRSQPGLALVLTAGIVARLALMPLGRGQDFVVWDLATRATLHGQDIYAHHPAYPAGPYAYLPLFVYLELPFQWLAQSTGIPFTILGKVPIVAGDVATALLLAARLRRSGVAALSVAIGVGAYFLNPLVLYDGAYYGRFDGLAVALLLLALPAGRRMGSSVWYALAIAAKTFPVFALPGFVRSGRSRALAGVGAVLLLVVLPYLSSWRAVFQDVVVYDARKTPQGLSWQTFIGAQDAAAVGRVCLAVFAAATVALLVVRDSTQYCLAVLLAFVLTSKVVLEQYLVWLLPLLVLVAADPRLRRSAAGLVLVATCVGMLANADVAPWGRSPGVLVVVLAVASAAVLVTIVSRSGGGGVPGRSPLVTALPRLDVRSMSTKPSRKEKSMRGASLPPRWFVVLFWHAHRALVRVTRGRLGLWRPKRNGWGALWLTTTGRRSGRSREVLVGYVQDGDNFVTMAMNGWSAPEPAWWLNLQAHPDATILTRDGVRRVRARRATGAERERLWARWGEIDKNLEAYAARRPDETAVVVLEPYDATKAERPEATADVTAPA